MATTAALAVAVVKVRSDVDVGLIGLGRMGANMSRRWVKDGHRVVGYARTRSTVEGLVADGAISEGADSLADLIGKLPSPRVIWLMVPTASVDATLDELTPHLAAGDMVVDGGNSYYIDDISRSRALAEQGIDYLDCGTSGGVWGLERGYCLMIGGPDAAVETLDPLFRSLAPGVDAAARTPGRDGRPGNDEEGYLHCGPAGAGHFVKMVHNGIEYGVMAAYAEGLNILRHANEGREQRDVDAETTPLRHPEHYQYDLDLQAVTEVWRRGSVIGSWLLDPHGPGLPAVPATGRLRGSSERFGRGTLDQHRRHRRGRTLARADLGPLRALQLAR